MTENFHKGGKEKARNDEKKETVEKEQRTEMVKRIFIFSTVN